MGWINPRPDRADPEALRAILKSLETYLRNPTFTGGVQLGDGTGPTYDPTTGTTTPPTTTPFDQTTVDDINDALPPDDGVAPGTVTGLTLTAGVNSIFARWDASAAADVKDGWGQYRIQLDNTSNTFPSPEVDKVVGGTFTSFTGLIQGVTCYVRVAAVDAYGNQSASWSTVASTAPLAVTNADIVAGSIAADRLVANSITAGQIAADAITANELAAITIETGKYIQSSNYVANTSGFKLDHTGYLEANDALFRGDITADSLTTQGSGDNTWIEIDTPPTGGGTGNGALDFYRSSLPVASVYGQAGGGINIYATDSGGAAITNNGIGITNEDVSIFADDTLGVVSDNNVVISATNTVQVLGDFMAIDVTDDVTIDADDSIRISAVDQLQLDSGSQMTLDATTNIDLGTPSFSFSGGQNLLGAFTDPYTPQLVQAGNRTSTENNVSVWRFGKLIIAQVTITCTTTGSAGNVISVSTPVNLANFGSNKDVCGSFHFYDASTGHFYSGALQAANTDFVQFQVSTSPAATPAGDITSQLGFDPSLALGSGDIISFLLVAEAA